jgi:molecular chaperone GrpE
MSENTNPKEDLTNDPFDSVLEQIETSNQSGDESPEQLVDMLEQQVADLRDRELKAQAELENFRKRLLRDTEQQLRYASSNLVRDMLDVVDNLNRATESAQKAGESGNLVDGVKLVLQQLTGVLEKHHCKPIPGLGKPFDPNIHQAIAQQPSADYAAGVVMMETSVGYTLHDRVIRPSMVIVSTGSGS